MLNVNRVEKDRSESVGTLLVNQFTALLEAAPDDWAVIELVMSRQPLDVEFKFRVVSKADLVVKGGSQPLKGEGVVDLE